jgi:hypothetical protein
MGAAIEISRIMDKYRANYGKYGFRTVNVLMTYALISAATVHLFDVPSKSLPRREYTEANSRALFSFWQILQDLTDMSKNHIYAGRGIKILRGLAEKNTRVFPEGRLDPPQPMSKTPTLNSPASSAYSSSAIPARHSVSDSGFQVPRTGHDNQGKPALQSYNGQPPAHPSLDADPPPSLHQVLIYNNALQTPSTAYHTSSIPSRTLALPNTSADTSISHNHPEANHRDGNSPNIFWTPIEGHQIPLYSQNHNTNTSPMDITNMLRQVDVWEQFNRDGFRVNEAWAQGPLVGVNEHTDGQLLNGSAQLQSDAGSSIGRTVQAIGSEGQSVPGGEEPGQSYQQQEWWPR